MRLDKFLKVSRLIKRRTVANEACDAGRVHANICLQQRAACRLSRGFKRSGALLLPHGLRAAEGGISARNTLLRGFIRQKKPKKRAECRFIQGIMRNLRRESANRRVKRLFTY